MKIITIVGARPQFIKAAMVSRAIIAHNQNNEKSHIAEDIIHTGQHFDANMSDIFFNQMGIPSPAVNFKINGGSHGEMTGRMLAAIELELVKRKPDMVMVYGDTNSTLAGALAASKLHIPVVHIEAGLRSFNREMPEEINRVLTDHVSSLLFCPTHNAVGHLAREGIVDGVHHVGDVMYDAALTFAEIAKEQSTILHDLGLSAGAFILATIHRAENTDDPHRLRNILKALQKLSEAYTVVFPVHPRTRAKLDQLKPRTLDLESNSLRFILPVSFIDMVQLERNAGCILTDSGGVQKEAYFHGVPCITLRDETEWIETVSAGWNQVVGANTDKIYKAFVRSTPGKVITEYGNGCTSELIVRKIIGCQEASKIGS